MLLIDAITVKACDSQVANRPVYVAIGVDLGGERDVLGLWLGPTGGEGAKQWATMLGELANRGLADALIVCCDGLKGLPESIRMTWPGLHRVDLRGAHGPQQLALRRKETLGAITGSMRAIYTAPTVEAAETHFEAFAQDWEHTWSAMIRAWRTSWDEFTPFLEFPAELRRVAYTTDEIVKGSRPDSDEPCGTEATSPTSKPPSRSSTLSPPPNTRTGATSQEKPTVGKPY